MSINLNVLIKRKRWLEALELAVTTATRQVPTILEQAGETMLQLGRYAELNELLDKLPDTLQVDPYVLFWRFRVARRLQEEEPLLSIIRETLDNHDAPELRAVYATHYLPDAERLKQTRRALSLKPSLITKHHYGLAVFQVNPEEAINILLDLTLEVRKTADTYWLVQVLNVLGFMLSESGYLQEGFDCFEEVLDLFAQTHSEDWQARLSATSNYIYAALLLGHTDKAKLRIDDLEHDYQDAYTTLKFSMRSVLGDYYLVFGNNDALSYHQLNFEQAAEVESAGNLSPRAISLNYVRALIAAERVDEALDLASSTYYALDTSEQSGLSQQVGLGLALSLIDPAETIKVLADLKLESLPFDVSVMGCAALAHAHLALDDFEAAATTIKRRDFGDLGRAGFLMLVASPAFEQVYDIFTGADLRAIIRNPQRFGELTKDSRWHRLKTLENETGLVEQYRYAQYLLSTGEPEKALELSRKIHFYWQEPLSQAVLMQCLASISDFDALSVYVDRLPDSKDALSAEAKVLILEASIKYYLYHKNIDEAIRAAYWAEALADEYRLTRYGNRIQSLLTMIAAKTSSNFTARPDTQDVRFTLDQDFESVLERGDVAKAETLTVQGLMSRGESQLVKALASYRNAEVDERFTTVNKLLSVTLPTPKMRFYQALLSLQVQVDEGAYSVDTALLLASISESAVQLASPSIVLPYAARVCPLGLAIASLLLEPLRPAFDLVTLVWNEPERKGIYRGNRKVGHLGKRLREAMIADGLTGEVKALPLIMTSKFGHTMYKQRLEESIANSGRSFHSVTNEGAVYRGINYFAAHGNKEAQEVAQQLLADNPYLNQLVNA